MNGCDSSIALPEESEDEFIVFDEGDDSMKVCYLRLQKPSIR